MKSLKFVPELADLILTGEKTTTWRLFDDKDLQKDDKLELINKETLEKFAEAIIVDVTEKPIKNLADSDWEGHEKFESEEKMYQTYKKYYDQEVNEDTLVKIVKFKLL